LLADDLLRAFAAAFALLTLCASLCASAAAAPSSRTQSIEARRRAVRALLSGRSADTEDAQQSKKAQPAKLIDFKQMATQEIAAPMTPSSDEAPAVRTSAATVTTQSLIEEDPIQYAHFELGMSATPYRPQGEVPLTGLGNYNLHRVSESILWGLEGRYLPWSIGGLTNWHWGFRLGAQYSKQSVHLAGPTGNSLGKTEVNSLISNLWLSSSYGFRWSHLWGWNLDVGPSRLDLIQTSASTLANQSDSLWLLMLQSGPSIKAGRWDLQLNYQYRTPFRRSGWAEMASSGVSLSVLYGLR
jgi:hypothetical protein